jgi:thioredoxin reductase (NADPH)
LRLTAYDYFCTINTKKMSEIKKVECLIIGSGPAGYTAAIYAARADMKPLMYEGLQPGGQLTTTNEVENFPGYPQGVTGPEMMVQLKDQALRFETEIKSGFIDKVDFSGEIHKCWADDGTEIHAETVIISTGASAKYLGLPSEQKYLEMGGGVSACAVCDGFFYRGQETVIVGAGDSACEEAHYLSKLCTKVTMLVRKDFRASKIMADRVKKTSNIEILYNTETVEVLGDDNGVTGARVIDTITKEVKDIPCTGFFVAIGHQPNTGIFKEFINLDDTGYIKYEQAGTSRTNIAGVFVAGDAADKTYRQAITAAGTGCMAALDAERYLAAKH